MKKNRLLFLIPFVVVAFVLGRFVASPFFTLSFFERYICKQEYARDKYECLTKPAEAFIKFNRADEVVDAIRQLRRDDRIFECHTLFHNIGEDIYNAASGLDDAIKKCGSPAHFCHHGCIHDVISAHLMEGMNHTMEMSLTSLCEPYIEDENNLFSTCVHGVGHGLYHVSNSISESLTSCEQFGEDAGECQGGAIMDYVEKLLPKEKEKVAGVLATICEPLPDEQKERCARVVANKLIYFYTFDDLRETNKLCEAFNSALMIKACQADASIVTQALQLDINK